MLTLGACGKTRYGTENARTFQGKVQQEKERLRKAAEHNDTMIAKWNEVEALKQGAREKMREHLPTAAQLNGWESVYSLPAGDYLYIDKEGNIDSRYVSGELAIIENGREVYSDACERIIKGGKASKSSHNSEFTREEQKFVPESYWYSRYLVNRETTGAKAKMIAQTKTKVKR